MMAKKTKVKFIKSPTAAPFFLAYSIGQFGEVDAEMLKLLLENEMVEAVKAPKATRESKIKKEVR